MTHPPRVVLDTNIVLSALVFGGGVAAKLRGAWQNNACMPLVSAAAAAELIRVLAYPKFRLSTEEQQELLADYLPYTTAVRIPEKMPALPTCRDPFDLSFLQLALAGRAKFLVSGDKDLLIVSAKFAIPILTPADFLARLHR
jgi:uncharacterized protein